MIQVKDTIHANIPTDKSTIMSTTASVSSTTIKIPKTNTSSKYFDFMKSHLLEKGSDKKPTNTRIGDKDLNIFSGSYHFSEEEYPGFLDMYYQEVFVNKKKEYLTETQLEEEGPILVDIDLRFGLDFPERAYTDDHIGDLLDVYLDEINKIFLFDEETKFSVFVFEKKDMKRVPDKQITKDGIHIIFGINTDHITQQVLRKIMVKKIEEAWGDSIPIINTWDDVLDAGISTGKTNWQLYGSTKPGFEAYALSKVFEITYDPDDGNIMRKQIAGFNVKSLFPQLSARCKTHPSYLFRDEFVEIRNEFLGSNPLRNKRQVAADGAGMTGAYKPSAGFMGNKAVLQIRTMAELNAMLNEFLDSIYTPTDYEMRETYDYVMTLPEQYYSNYDKWIRVGFVLRNISDSLFIVWIVFSAQWSKFNLRDIPDLFDKWMKFDMNNPNGLSKRSIMHWSKMDAKEKYKKVRENSIEFYIDQTLNVTERDLQDTSDGKKPQTKGCGDYDLAIVLYHLYKDLYVCVSIKTNIWYRYNNHRWEEIDSGTTLRKAISVEMRDMFQAKLRKEIGKLSIVEEKVDADKHKKIVNLKTDKIMDICLRLARTNDKKNIMTEAKDLFYDGSFLQKLDTNPHLLCFNNGVIDFKDQVFRRGYPEDYISKTTNIDYIPLNPTVHAPIMAEINHFMYTLFPVEELRTYMWEHLASTLIGTSVNQTFNMYIGVGSNGKSVLTSFMEKVLGEYKGDVPLSLVTDSRTKIGGLAPEMVALKGIRYAVMQEPKKGDQINEGVMKQITSGVDPIQARAPYMPNAITFKPQFKLVVCANIFMKINSQDNGTWRRIRIVDFMSLFTDNPVEGDKDKPYQFKKVEDITDKFDEWKEVFMAMLVKKAYETNGVVKDCNIVMKSSNSYRESQDFIAEFISDKIIIDAAGTISKSELSNEFTIWYQGTYGRGGPSMKDVQSYMDKRFGDFKKYKCWRGCKINYDNNEPIINVPDEEEEEIDVDDL